MKDMVPNRADNKAADLIRAVSKSALQLHMWLGRADPQQDRKSSTGGVDPSEPLSAGRTALPGRIWVCVSCTAGSGYVIELVVQNHFGCCVFSRMPMGPRVHSGLPSLVTPNSPENYPVISFSQI